MDLDLDLQQHLYKALSQQLETSYHLSRRISVYILGARAVRLSILIFRIKFSLVMQRFISFCGFLAVICGKPFQCEHLTVLGV